MVQVHFRLITPAFRNGELIPQRHTCDGDDVSPRLEWGEGPAGTRSFALIVDDPDAPGGTFTHWVLHDLPADVHELPEGDGSIGVAGRNDFHKDGYGGPCPPPNHGHHRYFFRLYALDIEALDLPPGAARGAVEERMEGHILARSDVMGKYQRLTG